MSNPWADHEDLTIEAAREAMLQSIHEAITPTLEALYKRGWMDAEEYWAYIMDKKEKKCNSSSNPSIR